MWCPKCGKAWEDGYVFCGEDGTKLINEPQHTLSDDRTYGPINPKMVCPHCQTKGKIRTKSVKQKKGISGGKAVAGFMTVGISLLAVGLSRKEKVTQAHCDNCGSTWYF
jgi:hypothetical protein